MQHFNTIKEYCKAIQIPAPKHSDFDVRSFQENMSTVVHKMKPFRHAFYAIAIKIEGQGKAISSHFSEFPEGSVVFFNSPFQILSWDILPDWQGFYIMMSQDFLSDYPVFNNFLENFPFFKMDESVPFQLKEENTKEILTIFNKIHTEYYSENEDKFQLIQAYVLLLLNHIKRYFRLQISKKQAEKIIKKADLKLLSRYQKLIENYFRKDTENAKINAHSPAFYAQLLHVHPNHLNAVVKTNLGITALQYIHKYLIHLAKSYLRQTDLSVKEIAYQLQFDSPNNFNTFFKKQTQQTPGAYRKSVNL